MTEHESLLILNAIPGLGQAAIRGLLKIFGSAEKVLSAPSAGLQFEQVLSPAQLEALAQFPREKFLRQEDLLIEKHSVKIIGLQDSDYPDNLREITDPPVVLYLRGRLKEESCLAVAIVGSRRASFYGIAMAEKFSRQLADLGITVVSGMARGIDSAAHRGCLKVKGTTIAVLGCGLSLVYPPENKKIMEDIAAAGAVISEFPMTMPPLACNFPRRNRIVSGLSLGVIVVEASLKSGALITSRFALEQGREVFAVPGDVNHPNAQGVHRLIQQGAKLAGSVEDVLEELQPRLRGLTAPPAAKRFADPDEPGNALSDKEKEIYSCINEKPRYIDEVVMNSKGSVDHIGHILLKLEMKRLVKQLPGHYFVRT